MMRRIKRLTGVLIVLMVVAGCGGGASQEEEATPTPIPTPIVPTKPTYEVKRGEVVRELEFTGRTAPVVEQELFFRTAGYVGTVYVERDDFVETGDLLAELEVIDLKNQLLQAEAALEMAIANNEKRLTEAETSLRSTELRLASAKVDNPASQVTIAEVGLERAKIALSEAQEAYDEAWDPGRDWELDIAWKKKALENEREATERALRQAELSLKVAEAQYQQALQSLEKHQYNVEICEHEVELARLRLEQLEAGLDIEEIKLNVQRLRDLLNDAQLKAPFDGQVLSLSITDGRAVEGYRPVMVIGELSELEVSASLQGSQMEDLQEEMPVAVTIASRPGEEIKGQIRRLPYPYGGGGRISSDAEERDESTRVSLQVSATDGGLDHPTSGVVRVLGRDISGWRERELTQWRRERVGFIFQSFGLLPTLSAYENVELMPRMAGVGGKERYERTLHCLDLVGLGNWVHHRPFEMSGGQQQRVGIARALVNNPQLILADEPTGELDSTTAREILGLFRRIVDEEHVTLVMVSHDALVDEYVDEVVQLKDGQIIHQT